MKKKRKYGARIEGASSDESKKPNLLSRHQTLSAFLVILCLSIYTLNANPFAGQTVGPFNMLMIPPGWSMYQTDHQINTQPSDILDSLLPVWITLKDNIRTGRGALWYPNGAGGQPIALELFDPTFLLFIIIKDNALAFYLVLLMKLVIAGFGGFLLLRAFVSWLPSLWGGVVFMLCGFNTAWMYWQQVTTSMWIPWLLWTTFIYLKTDNMRWLPTISLVSLLLIFGGFPAVAAFGFYSFALFVLFWNLSVFFGRHWIDALKDPANVKNFLKKTASPFLSAGIAFIMAGIVLIPLIENMTGINMGYRIGGGTSFERIQDLSLFFRYEIPLKVERTAFVGIPVLVFALIGILSAFQANDETLKKFTFFTVLLLVITILIAYGFLPYGIIRSIPIFNFNRWSRLIVIPDLGLAVLSSIGMNFLLTSLPVSWGQHVGLTDLNSRRLLVFIILSIAAYQFHSQKVFFNQYNAVVPSSWFYPSTLSTAYVKERLKPLQSVIADDSYLLSGTLGAYGIPEWYAHSFRTDKEKEVLSRLVYEPFLSPTSAYIYGGNIQFNSLLMDKLVIKYVLLNRILKDVGAIHYKIFSFPGLPHKPAPPLPENSWKQHIHISDDMMMSTIGFLFETDGEKHAPANVRLALYRADGSKYPVEPELDKNQITNRQWGFFKFPDLVSLKKGYYYVTLSVTSYKGTGGFTAWVTKNQDTPSNFLEINDSRMNVSLMTKIGHYELAALNYSPEKWNVIDLEKNISIFENKHVTNSAYYINDLAPSNERIDFSGINVRHVSAHQINIDYRGKNAGWIVLPMHLNKGWKAYIDNRQVKYDTYIDILPAIPVKGTAQIIFKFEPESFQRGAIVSLIGIALFLILLRVCSQTKRGQLRT